jgi:predicted membrane channel-forming protein YqfA (hemolysin III family)
MQKIATRVFVISSVLFGVVGIAFALTIPRDGESMTDLNHVLFVLLAAIGFVVLSSFAVSVAGKYLNGDG